MHEMNELTWINWNEWLDMKDLKLMKWNAWLEMSELKRMTWHERLDMKELTWAKCNQWMAMNALKWRGAHPRKQRPSSGDHGRRKNTSFCARECFQAWIHAFPIAHTSQRLDDDVVDMMMWFPPWQQLAVRIVPNYGNFLTKLPLIQIVSNSQTSNT